MSIGIAQYNRPNKEKNPKLAKMQKMIGIKALIYNDFLDDL